MCQLIMHSKNRSIIKYNIIQIVKRLKVYVSSYTKRHLAVDDHKRTINVNKGPRALCNPNVVRVEASKLFIRVPLIWVFSYTIFKYSILLFKTIIIWI